MALILSLETSTAICSAALHDEGNLIVAKEVHTPQSASSYLAPIIHDLLNDSGITSRQIKAVAVAAGPGSYTGLRIGVSMAKGLCFALQIPLIAINTLELMAYQAKNSPLSLYHADKNQGSVFLCPMLDARRMEVYCLLADLNLNIVEPTQAKIIDVDSFKEWLQTNTILFFGNGADKCRDQIQSNAIFIEGINPLASKLGEMAFLKFKSRKFEDLFSFEPLYLKEFLVKKPKTV